MNSTPKTRTTARSAGSPADNGYAMSCLRANPLTGEMIDGDVIFDAELHPVLEATVRPADRQHDGHRTAKQPWPLPWRSAR